VKSSFPEVNCGRGVLLTTHPLLVARSWKSRAITLLTLWATTGLVTGLLYFTFGLKHRFETVNNNFPALNQGQSQIFTEFFLDIFGDIVRC